MSFVLFSELTEDYSLGKSLSDTSEKVLKSGKKGARIYRSFCWEKKKKKSMLSNIKTLLITKTKHLKLIISVLFIYEKM